MPKMNGLNYLKEIVKMPELRRALIYMYSTTADSKTIEESSKLGAKFFVKPPSPVKPPSLTALVKMLRELPGVKKRK